MTWLVAQLLATPAMGQGCQKVSVGDLGKAPGPGVLVLGERHGTKKDLKRARKIALKLAKQGPVTVALEAVPAAHADVLAQFVDGKLALDALPAALDWDNDWGFSFDTYVPLFSLADQGIELRAIGAPIGLRPPDAIVQLPPGYVHVLVDAMGETPVPVELEGRTVQTVAWHDQQLASSAITPWDGKGWLILVVDRTWIEGGLGVQWQAQLLTDAKVDAALLAHAGTRCYEGDRTLP